MSVVKDEEGVIYKIKNTLSANEEDDLIERALSIIEKRMRRSEFCITSPQDVKKYLNLKVKNLDYESFQVLFLNNQHNLIEIVEMFKGTFNVCSVYPREVVKKALELNATAVILSHNHPSGIAEPSSADKETTIKLKAALELVETKILDHFVVGDTIISFAERGYL